MILPLLSEMRVTSTQVEWNQIEGNTEYIVTSTNIEAKLKAIYDSRDYI